MNSSSLEAAVDDYMNNSAPLEKEKKMMENEMISNNFTDKVNALRRRLSQVS